MPEIYFKSGDSQSQARISITYISDCNWSLMTSVRKHGPYELNSRDMAGLLKVLGKSVGG